MILHVEVVLRQVIGEDLTYFGDLVLRSFGVQTQILRQRSTLCHFRSRRSRSVEPSAESFSCSDRHILYAVSKSQSRTAFYYLRLTDEGLAVGVEITHLYLRHEVTCLRKEIRYIGLRAELEGQRSSLLYVVGPGDKLVIVRFLLTASSFVADSCESFAVLLDRDICLAILASTDGEFHRTVNGHRDRTALYTMLTAVIRRAGYRHAGRQLTAFRENNGIRIIAELDLEIRKRTYFLFAVDNTVDLYVAQAEELAAIKARHIESQADGLSGCRSDCVRVVQRRRTGGVVVTQQIFFRNLYRSSLHAVHGVRPVIRGIVCTLLDSIVLHAREGESNTFLHLHTVLDHRGSVRTGFAGSGVEGSHRLTGVR